MCSHCLLGLQPSQAACVSNNMHMSFETGVESWLSYSLCPEEGVGGPL